MDRKIYVIMPMAGEGTRFKTQGYTVPKPLLKAKNKYFYQRAIESLNLENIHLICITQEKHNIAKILDTEIIYKHDIIELKKITDGAATTAFIGLQNLNDTDIVIILDCDLEFKCTALTNYLNQLLISDILTGGALVIFNSNKPYYSYVECDNNNYATRTAEKQVISNNAICGAYIFNSVKEFKDCYNKCLFNNEKEKYISCLYNYMSGKIRVFKLDYYASFGTPEELLNYEKTNLF